MGNTQKKSQKNYVIQTQDSPIKMGDILQKQEQADQCNHRTLSLPPKLSTYSKEIQRQLFLKQQQAELNFDLDFKDNLSIIKHKETLCPVFKGQINHEERNGFGVQYDQNGKTVYQGFFRFDEYDGWGKTSFYEGQFRDNLYDGFGTLNTQNILYSGYFRNGLFDGNGIIFIGKHLKKSKEMIQEPLNFLLFLLDKNMQNVKEYGIQEVYLGNWTQGHKNGLGKIWIKDTAWYSGQFHRDLYHGVGVLSDPLVSKKVIQGCFVNGKQI